MCPPPQSSSPLPFNGLAPSDARELRSELETLDPLYQLLARQWRHAYAQASAQKRKGITSNNE